MLFAFFRKLFLTLLTLIILSVISYAILQRDPLNNLQGNDIYAYLSYVQGLLQGDWGISHNTGEPLVKQVLSVFPATISLCLSASFLSLILGIPLGFLLATQQHNIVGKWLATLSSLSLAVPVFWLAILLMAYSSLNHWEISAVGEIHPIYAIETQTGIVFLDIFLSNSPYKLKMMQSALHHLLLPTLILAIPATLEVMRMTGERSIYVMKQNYVKVAKTRGWSPFKIWWHHIMRNTLAPLVPMIARNITLIFAFGMLIENVVSWGGIGRWLINALAIQDYHAISVGVVAIGLFVLSVDLLASLITTLLDPTQKKDWYVR
ncbi:peptide ABC transporter permease [Vespertiliibacter pulmonis]|uniref:Cationic peptide transport system permease protein n=1 Tax=Vespertiliibacter pulmonis TaxID=1443036 RepID=A0A3N4VS70_9PAST|nr:ABC transporter permease subunit [Vespertiliibacter pulmonis]QLB21528.1 peptide ABC transporter permease [Vespertiliibacter pulmonis]RPE85946.1 cationic peptide transport system permease protein [Vespertiliibacter pulmonis]